MNLADYQECLGRIEFGKRLPTALYLYWESNLSGELRELLEKLREKLELGEEFNVLKLHTNALKISFLCYPEFLNDPHPALAEAVTVDLAAGKTRRVDYQGRENPPILHRKEAFLPPGHPKIRLFRKLTKQEEEAGLYAETTTIGFKLNWERLLRQKGLGYRGHTLVEFERDEETAGEPKLRLKVDRYRTAMARGELSKPVKTLLEFGLLRKGTTFFDYGCGQRFDVSGLAELGFEASGWDPVFAPDQAKPKAQVVNLGYVINVIEDPVERVETLIEAWGHAEEVLVVSSMIRGWDRYEFSRDYSDGLLTSRNTFQKYFEQTELQSYIEDALGHDAVPVGLGIFYVFRDALQQQDFISSRSKRVINWEEISHRLGVTRRPRLRVDQYELHKDLLDAFWARMLELGRIPKKKEEFELYEDVRSAVRSANQAARLFVEKFGQETLEEARKRRRDDLLVYLAVAQFQKRVPFNHLSSQLQTDIKTFFGHYKVAIEEARELLFAAGDPGEIELAVDGLDFGWMDENEGHFTIHRTLLDELPAILRVYVQCGAMRYGDPHEADLIKIHTRSRKLTFQYYDDFDGQPLPELVTRIKIDLKNFFVNVFDHTEGPTHQLIFFKERFLPKEYSDRERFEVFSAKLRKLGLREETIGYGPDKEAFHAALKRVGLNENLNKIRKSGN